MRAVFHPAYLRQILRSGGAWIFRRREVQATGALDIHGLRIETVLAIGLVFRIYTTYADAIAFIHLVVAAAAVWRVTRGKWLWNIGGYEYCVFWAICCLVVAMHG